MSAENPSNGDVFTPEQEERIREICWEELRKLGLDVAKYGGTASLGALLAWLIKNREKLEPLLSGARESIGERATDLRERTSSLVDKIPIRRRAADRIREVEEILTRLRDRFARGEITKEEYEQLKEDYERELERLRRGEGEG